MLRLLIVIHHENIHELTSLRFLKLNLEYQNIKMGRRTYEDIFFQLNTTVSVFFKKAAIIIAILHQKTLQWQLGKVIPSGMFNCNFEAIN